eukprot:6048867-Pyramimonas_sp.AAC.1
MGGDTEGPRPDRRLSGPKRRGSTQTGFSRILQDPAEPGSGSGRSGWPEFGLTRVGIGPRS